MPPLHVQICYYTKCASSNPAACAACGCFTTCIGHGGDSSKWLLKERPTQADQQIPTPAYAKDLLFSAKDLLFSAKDPHWCFPAPFCRSTCC